MEARGLRLGSLVGLAVAVAALSCCLTALFLAMRAVMDIGGSCASGGPYEIAQPCPDGVAAIFPLAILAGLVSAGAVAGFGGRFGLGWLALLAWPALFLSLGWNFLEDAFDP